jgi:hypothetical protein
MIAMGALGIQEPVSVARRNGIVGTICIFVSGYSMGWAPMTYILTTELSALRLRDLTSRVGFTTNVCTNFAVNFMIPYLIYDDYAGLGSKVGFIFGGCMVVAFIFTFFCVPECKGKTLEEVDQLFRLKVPIRQFGSFDMSRLEPIDGTLPPDKGAVRLNEIEVDARQRTDTDEEKGAAK